MDFQAIIKKWPNAADLGRDLKVKHETVKQWRARNSIPGAHWRNLIEAARARGIQGVSYDTLSDAAAFRYKIAFAGDALPPTHVSGSDTGLGIYGGLWRERANSIVPSVAAKLSPRAQFLLMRIADGVSRTVSRELHDRGCVWFGRASAHITPLGDLVAEHLCGLRGVPRKADRLKLYSKERAQEVLFAMERV